MVKATVGILVGLITSFKVDATNIETTISANPKIHQIKVIVEGLRNKNGNVVFCLWRKEDSGFPKCELNNSFMRIAKVASDPTATFAEVPAGEYAISFFHDEQNKGKMDTNFLGLPKGGVGVSGEFGKPPRFSRSKISILEDQDLRLTIKYF